MSRSKTAPTHPVRRHVSHASAFVLSLFFAMAGLLAGCGNSTKPIVSELTVTQVTYAGLTVVPASLVTGSQATFSAMVTNDPKYLGMDWTVTCDLTTGTNPCGYFTPTHTANGVTTVYTAPELVPVSGTVTITVSATENPTRTASTTLMVTTTDISVSLIAANPTVQIGQPLQITPTVLNDSSNEGVSWSVTCSSTVTGACGTFNPLTTFSGTPTTYTAPATQPTGGTVTITAASIADPSKTASVVINISVVAVFPISITITPSSASVQTGTTQTFTATVQYDSQNAGVTWSLLCGNTGQCGSLSTGATASGAPVTYTAPNAVPSGGTVTLTATSITDSTKFSTATITVTSAP